VSAAIALPPGDAVATNEADRAPPALGVNTTFAVQDVPGASAAEQVVELIAKSLALAPASISAGAPLGTAPLLLMVNVIELGVPSGAEPKSCVAGAITSFAGAMPVPLSAAALIPPGVAEAESDPARAPVAVGAKCTATMQEPPAMSGAVQPLAEMAKSPVAATAGTPD
jgi:hypothetical protein